MKRIMTRTLKALANVGAPYGIYLWNLYSTTSR